MKSTSNEKPSVLQRLGLNLWAYNYNVTEVTGQENETMYSYDTLTFDHLPTIDEVISEVIRTKYTISEEIKLSYRRDADIEEFILHEDFVLAVKTMVKSDFENEEI